MNDEDEIEDDNEDEGDDDDGGDDHDGYIWWELRSIHLTFLLFTSDSLLRITFLPPNKLILKFTYILYNYFRYCS